MANLDSLLGGSSRVQHVSGQTTSTSQVYDVTISAVSDINRSIILLTHTVPLVSDNRAIGVRAWFINTTTIRIHKGDGMTEAVSYNLQIIGD